MTVHSAFDNNAGLERSPAALRQAPDAADSLAAKIIRKLAKPFFRKIEFDIARLGLRDFAGPSLRPSLSVRFAGPGQTPDELVRLFGPDVRKFFDDRLESGDLALVHDAEGREFLGYAWGSRSEQKNEGVPPFLFDVKPRPGSAYLYDFFVLPEKRRRGALEAAVAALLGRYRDQGLDSVFYLFNAASPAMRAFSAKAGFETVGRISHVRTLWNVRIDLADLRRTVCL